MPSGSSYGLEPIEGFVESSDFAGFEDLAAGASIMLVEMPPAAYERLVATPDAAIAAKGGFAVSARETFMVGTNAGTLLIGRQHAYDTDYNKWVLLFVTPDFTGMVTVAVPADAAATHTEAEVRAALARIVIVPKRSLAEQVASLPFAFEATETLRLAATMAGNSAALTIGPKDIDPQREQPLLIITSTMSMPCTGEPHALAQEALGKTATIAIVEIESMADVGIAGGQGVETIANVTDIKTGAPLRAIQWVGPFGTPRCALALGLARPEQAEAAFVEFRKVIDSVRFKDQP